eukprot:CAMPEP_0175878982 /NCGR_PEP_ID=MMETSP0107_2-20121207/41509_1 /TAXON_ID=195067 ORGANISM="Goniomonas pacifica, Strain CCMP1869" /NCGR_SAMPLE_ID=MMETSP0107_2 /ASSEMBLY_ACC=CAM_ASM_000203 /LENGTH=225 /DNA_ID=CAMNT_0017198565 /DNA_START=107 /DNA_END=784 /DNA_ORIENTATION=-
MSVVSFFEGLVLAVEDGHVRIRGIVMAAGDGVHIADGNETEDNGVAAVGSRFDPLSWDEPCGVPSRISRLQRRVDAGTEVTAVSAAQVGSSRASDCHGDFGLAAVKGEENVGSLEGLLWEEEIFESLNGKTTFLVATNRLIELRDTSASASFDGEESNAECAAEVGIVHGPDRDYVNGRQVRRSAATRTCELFAHKLEKSGRLRDVGETEGGYLRVSGPHDVISH